MAVGARSIGVARWRLPWEMGVPWRASLRAGRGRRRRVRGWTAASGPQPVVWSLERDEVRATLERDWR